jgi:hypothetical protein
VIRGTLGLVLDHIDEGGLRTVLRGLLYMDVVTFYFLAHVFAKGPLPAFDDTVT